MSIIAVAEIETSLQMTENFEWNRVAVYEVTSDDPKEDPGAVWGVIKTYSNVGEIMGHWGWGRDPWSGPPAPLPAPPTKTDTGLFHIGTDVRLRNVVESRVVWRVTLRFEDFNMLRRNRVQQANAAKGTDGATPYIDKAGSAQDEGPRWKSITRQVEEEATVDRRDQPIVNTADQPYPPQKVFKSEELLVVEYFSSSTDMGLRSEFLSGMAMNNAPFLGYPRYCLRMATWETEAGNQGYVEPADINVPTVGEGLQPVVWNRITFGIQLGQKLSSNPDVWQGWRKRLPNYGTVQKDAQGTNFEDKYKAIEIGTTVSGGLLPGVNVMLDAAGKPAADQTTMLYNEFEHYLEADFNRLPEPVRSLPPQYTNSLIPPP